jgi:integrase
MPNYSREGKIEYPITDKEFAKGIETGHFVQEKHKGFAVLLWLTGLRLSEGLALRKDQFRIDEETLYIDTGIRKKKRRVTKDGRPKKLKAPDPLPLPLDAPYMNLLLDALQSIKPDERIFPYCDKTGYNIVRRVWKYPHWFRLSRITNFIQKGYRIADIKSWTSLRSDTIDSYVGRVELKEMGKSLIKENSFTDYHNNP